MGLRFLPDPTDDGPAGRRSLDPPAPVHGDPIVEVAVSGESRGVTASRDRTVRVWSLPTLAETLRIQLKTSPKAMAVSPNGRLLAVAQTYRVVVVDLHQQVMLGASERTRGEIVHLEYSPDSARLLAATQPSSALLLLDPHSAEVRERHRVPNTFPRPAICWSEGLAATLDHPASHLQVRTLGSGEELRRIPLPALDFPRVAVSPVEPLVALAGGKREGVLLVDLAEGRVVGDLEGHSRGVWSMAFSADGHSLATRDDTGAVHLWDLRSRRRVRTAALPGLHTRGPLHFADEGRLLLVGCGAGLVALRTADGRLVAGGDRPAGGLRKLALAPDGASIASLHGRGHIRLRALPGGRRLRDLEIRVGAAEDLFFAAGGAVLAAPTKGGGPTHAWNVEDGTPIRSWPREGSGPRPEGHPAAASPDGRLIATTAWSRSWVWDLEAGAAASGELQHGGRISRAAFDSQGRLWTLGGNRGLGGDVGDRRGYWLRTWRPGAGSHTEWEVPSSRPPFLELAPDASAVAIGDEAGIRVLRVPSGEVLDSLPRPPAANPRGVLALAQDASAVAYSAAQGGFVLWRLGGSGPRTLGPDTGQVESLLFSPDGAALYSGHADGRLLAWDVGR